MKTHEDINNEINDYMEKNNWLIPPEKIMELAIWQEKFQAHVKHVTEGYIQALGYERSSVSEIEWYNDHIVLIIEIYQDYYAPTHDSASMPIHYLWNTDKQEEIKQMFEDLKAAQRNKAEADTKKHADDQRKADLKQLETLKAKYEGEE